MQYRSHSTAPIRTLLLSAVALLLSLPSLTAQNDDRNVVTRERRSDKQVFKTWRETKDNNGLTYRWIEDGPFPARYYTLDNGLTVILSPNPTEPRVQTLIAVRAGSKHDPAHATGLAHYLEHMLFKGTDRYGTKDWASEKREIAVIEDLYNQYNTTSDEDARRQIYRAIDSVSGVAARFAIPNEYDRMVAMIGATGTNAFTSTEQTVYVNEIPSNQIDRWLAIEAERFRAPVFRLFHTELEAVYEEKNLSIDRDGSRMWETLGAALFENHPYGTQTTIGTIEHLKNPSLSEIRKYYDAYYVPNNMAVIMAGDLDPEETIVAVRDAFSYMKPKPVPGFSFKPEPIRTSPRSFDVVGPEPPQVVMAWRMPKTGDPDSWRLEMADLLLAYKGVGMLELNLSQKQKVKSAGCSPSVDEDYCIHYFFGEPIEGQSLEEVKDLMLGEIERLKNGEFDVDQMRAVVRNLKVDEMQRNRENSGRAYTLLGMYVTGDDPARAAAKLDALSKMTKQEIVDFANRYYTDDYVVVYKREGPKPDAPKVEKPQITPIELDRTSVSPFVEKIASATSEAIAPVYIDYENDIARRTLSGGSGPELLHVTNEQDRLFELYYVLDMGSDNDPLLPLAVSYLNYIGTDDRSPDEMRRAFFELGCSYSVSSRRDQTYVTLTGPDESFADALELFDKFLEDAEGDTESLAGLISLELQGREEAKSAKRYVLQSAMTAYAQFGENNHITDFVPAADLERLQPSDLTDRIRKLTTWKHRVLYYGPLSPDAAATTISKVHDVKASKLRDYPEPTEYERQPITENVVYVVDFPDMVGAEVVWVRDAGPYDLSTMPTRMFFNEYFGGGMSSIVFQEIRESKALAYGTYSVFRTPSKPEDPNEILSYVGTQADKLSDAITAMNELHTNLPQSPAAMNAARSSLRNKYETGRTTGSSILFNYLTALRFGFTEDNRRLVYDNIDVVDLADLTAFHSENYTGKPFAICVIGAKDRLDMQALAGFGKVVELEVEEVLGY